MKSKIIFEDKDIIIAYKPAGFPVQSAKPGVLDMESELRSYLKHRDAMDAVGTATAGIAAKAANNAKKPDIAGGCGKGKPTQQMPYLGIVHRLDQPVEGLLVFAKNKKTAAALTAQLSSQTLHKQYYAVVCGYPSEEQGCLVDYLQKDSKMQKALVLGAENRKVQNGDWKKAILKYERKAKLSTPYEISLLDIHIETGRFHQIRAQLAHAGIPILGDSKYGNERVGEISTALGIRTVALCAASLSFVHPVTGKKLAYRRQPESLSFGLFGKDAFK